MREHYLNPDDVRGAPLRVEIASVWEAPPSFDVIFTTDEALVLDATHCRALVRAYGPELNNWVGQQIELSFSQGTIVVTPISLPITAAEMERRAEEIGESIRCELDAPFLPVAKREISQAEMDAENRRREAILALLDVSTRAAFETDVNGDHLELLDLVGMAEYVINVDGTPAQIAELINCGYRGTDDVLRSVDTALAIARGETAEAKAAREAREVEDRREFVERCLGLLREHVHPDLVVVGLPPSEGTAEP